VSIGKSGKRFYLGRYDDEIEAALAYDRKAEELFGEFAYLNFPGLATKTLRKVKSENAKGKTTVQNPKRPQTTNSRPKTNY